MGIFSDLTWVSWPQFMWTDTWLGYYSSYFAAAYHNGQVFFSTCVPGESNVNATSIIRFKPGTQTDTVILNNRYPSFAPSKQVDHMNSDRTDLWISGYGIDSSGNTTIEVSKYDVNSDAFVSYAVIPRNYEFDYNTEGYLILGGLFYYISSEMHLCYFDLTDPGRTVHDLGLVAYTGGLRLNGMGMAYFESSIYIMGGWRWQSGPNNTSYYDYSTGVAIYEPSSSSWSVGPGLPVGMSVAQTVPDKNVLFAYGDTATPAGAAAVGLVGGKWQTIPEVQYRESTDGFAAGGGYIYVSSSGASGVVTHYSVGPGPYLRMTQRDDRLGIVKHPRLTTPANHPTSRQLGATPRLGQNNRYQ